jgi:hypothetical protein
MHRSTANKSGEKYTYEVIKQCFCVFCGKKFSAGVNCMNALLTVLLVIKMFAVAMA